MPLITIPTVQDLAGFKQYIEQYVGYETSTGLKTRTFSAVPTTGYRVITGVSLFITSGAASINEIIVRQSTNDYIMYRSPTTTLHAMYGGFCQLILKPADAIKFTVNVTTQPMAWIAQAIGYDLNNGEGI